MGIVKIALILLPLLFIAEVLADQGDAHRKSVEDIAKQIKQISRNLNANKSLLKNEQDELSNLEQELLALQNKARKIKQQIYKTKIDLQRRDQEIHYLQGKYRKQLEGLNELLLSRYKKGKPSFAKMVLKQQNPYAVGRLGNYYQYFAEAQRQQMESLQAQLIEINSLRTLQEKSLKELESTKNQQAESAKVVNQAKLKRAQTVTRLSEKVSSSTQKLQQLRQDRSRLNTLLNQIAAQAKKLQELDSTKPTQNRSRERPKRAVVQGGFLKQQGRLNYPVSINPRSRFGERLPGSGMRSQGMFFESDKKLDVRSIFRGQVLFSGYLKGYGLLLIIDHGDDHISLYGHNDVLYKEVGDSVETYEIVAKSGLSGGLKSPGLYFEIRHNATPINPSKWCT